MTSANYCDFCGDRYSYSDSGEVDRDLLHICQHVTGGYRQAYGICRPCREAITKHIRDSFPTTPTPPDKLPTNLPVWFTKLREEQTDEQL